MKTEVDLLIVHASQLVTLAGPNERPRTGGDLDTLGLVVDGAVAAAEGGIVAGGPTAQGLRAALEVDVIPTFLGAYAAPPEYAQDPDAYVNVVTNEMLPAVVEEDLAEFCDVMCAAGAFTPEQARTVLEAGLNVGLDPKIHADESSDLGGAALGADVEAISADHLVYSSDDGLRSMAEAGTIGVLLPGPVSGRSVPYARARPMVDLGVPIALGSDYNPPTSPEYSMPTVVALACRDLQLTPEEAIVAATINAAHAVSAAEEVGSLDLGKAADIVILDLPDYRQWPTPSGGNPVAMVVKRGRVGLQTETGRRGRRPDRVRGRHASPR